MKRVVFYGLALTVIFSFFFMTGCGKKKSPLAPVPTRPVDSSTDIPARAGAPTIELSASPSTIERGQQTTLTWKTANASSVLIDGGIGNVAESGSVVVSPRESVTYTATAKGAAGETKASTRITVVDPKAAGGIDVTDIDNLARAIQEGKIRDIFFAYDQAELTSEAQGILEENARWIRRFPRGIVVIEGHCDERGTEEYNLALGDRRALGARDYLMQLGVDPNQVETISYGEERPFDPGRDEAAWSQNRRAHFVAKRF